MFDLKTATRLYILEGHKQHLAACSFSPDGRRLITVSLDENVVLVWKVGSSFSSFFHPGAPPRQGHGNGGPFKTWEFNVGDTGERENGPLPAVTNIGFLTTATRPDSETDSSRNLGRTQDGMGRRQEREADGSRRYDDFRYLRPPDQMSDFPHDFELYFHVHIKSSERPSPGKLIDRESACQDGRRRTMARTWEQNVH